jgi:hypothetical protein
MRNIFSGTTFAALAAAGLLLRGAPARAQAPVGDPGPDHADRRSRTAARRNRGEIENPLLRWYGSLSAANRAAFLEEHPDLNDIFEREIMNRGPVDGRAALAPRFAEWLKQLGGGERRTLYGEHPDLEKAANAEFARAEALRIEKAAHQEKIDALLRAWFDGLAPDERTELLRRHEILKAIIEHRRKFARDEERPGVASKVFCQWYRSLDHDGLRELFESRPSLKTRLGKYADEALLDDPAALPTSSRRALPEEDSD